MEVVTQNGDSVQDGGSGADQEDTGQFQTEVPVEVLWTVPRSESFAEWSLYFAAGRWARGAENYLHGGGPLKVMELDLLIITNFTSNTIDEDSIIICTFLT